jgi:hypothetical protein
VSKDLKITPEIKGLAHEYGPMAINELARLAVKAESEAAGGGSHQGAARPRLRQGNAANPRTVDYGISQQLAEVFKKNAGNTLGQEIARRAALPPPKLHRPRAGASRFPAIASTRAAGW